MSLDSFHQSFYDITFFVSHRCLCCTTNDFLADHSADGEHNQVSVSNGKKLRFVQLYTSRSYEDRRNQLVTPADEEENYRSQVGGEDEEDKDDERARKKHVLSPLLVDAISKTAQVVWAHTKKQEGLTGRSDMRLQTAVAALLSVFNLVASVYGRYNRGNDSITTPRKERCKFFK